MLLNISSTTLKKEMIGSTQKLSITIKCLIDINGSILKQTDLIQLLSYVHHMV